MRNKLTFKLQRTANEYAAERSFAVLCCVSVNLYVKLFRIYLYTYRNAPINVNPVGGGGGEVRARGGDLMPETIPLSGF